MYGGITLFVVAGFLAILVKVTGLPSLPWIIMIVVWLQCGVACIVIAESKHRDPLGWFVYGLLFGIIGVLMAIGVPPLSPGTDEKSEPVAEPRRRIGRLSQASAEGA